MRWFLVDESKWGCFGVVVGKPYVDIFEGGYLFQTFLSGANYHRIHAPVAGTVVKVVTPTNGLYFSLAESFGADPDQILSEVYFTAVNQRMLIFIEADNTAVGTVCVMPIGITEISSVRLSIPDPGSTTDPAVRVSKGQEIACFSYGGSSCVLLFQNGAIDHFTAPVPPSSKFSPPDGPAINVNASIAIAHPRPLLKESELV